MTTNFEEIMNDMDKRTTLTNDFYKLAEGDNRMRILTEFTKVITMNEGKTYKGIFSGTLEEEKKWIEAGEKDKDGKSKRRTSFKAWAWAIVRGKDGDEFKIVQFGSKIIKQLWDYKKSPDYGFDSFPMPYDVNIKATGAGTLDVEYTVIPARQNTEVTPAELDTLNHKRSIADIVQAMINKQNGVKTEGKKPDYPEESSETGF